jgi:hypothetical protein
MIFLDLNAIFLLVKLKLNNIFFVRFNNFVERTQGKKLSEIYILL